MDEEKEIEKDGKIDSEISQNIPKVSQIIFDEKAGTVTLKIASEEEIAQAEQAKKDKT